MIGLSLNELIKHPQFAMFDDMGIAPIIVGVLCLLFCTQKGHAGNRAQGDLG